MNLENLKNWTRSSYFEDTEDQIDFYINEGQCEVGDRAYLYDHSDDALTEMEIIHIISRMDDMEHYDNLDDDILIKGEENFGADTSAEFITDNDCYLVWFKYV
jgi:hypothetical protein